MNNQLNNIPEKYRNFIQLSDISTQYRKFSKGQYIEYTQFNEFLDFFEDQDRLSRVMLQGVGIVCGFKPELTYSNKKLNSIKLSQGVAVTTDGDLLTLNNTSKVSEELYVSDLKTISIDNKEYTHFKKYDNFKVNYPAFYDENGGQIELWELATVQEATSDFQPVANFSNLKDQYLMLYLESYEKEVKPCRGVDCDNHGIQQIRNLKVLVTNEQGANYILQKDRIQPHPLFIEDILGSVKQERVILERLIQEKGIETRFSYADLKNMYADVLERNGYGELVFRKIYEISKMFGLPVADHLTFKSVLEECLNLPFGFQYAYDVVKDLTATYSEIIRLLPKTFTKCLPDFASFPKHMMLGKLNSETQLDSSRHQFYNSPVLDDEKAMQRVKTLITRFNQQVQNFKYPNRFEGVEKIGNDQPIEAESAIKITPSQKSEFLGNKAIPFYYRITDDFLKVWDFNKVRTPAFRNNVGYNSGLFSQESYVRKPLGFNIDRAPFYNIEGHQGMHYQDAFDQIKKIRDEQQLGFDIMLLSFKELLKNKDLSKAYFNEYIDKYSGLEHKHGVEKGGTFIMVYDHIGRDEVIVADFSLPYICCTPKVKINLSLPNTTICAKAEKIPFTVFPFNGIVTANVDSDLNGGVQLIDGLYFFDPASVSQELHNQPISFSVNGKSTDCNINVITEPQVRIVVEKVDIPESDSTATVVKFKITGEHFMDYQYSWDFLDNGSQVIQNPDSKGFVTHTFNNLSPRKIPNIKVKVIGGGCEQNVSLENWYVETPIIIKGIVFEKGGDCCEGANAAPIAQASASQTTIQLPTDSVMLIGSSSYDSDGTIVSYEWKQITSPSLNANIISPNTADTTVTGLVEGIYKFQLLVKDNNGTTATDEVIITVNKVDLIPTLTQTDNTTTGPGGTRQQIFKVGPNVSAGNKFQTGVYSVVLTVVATSSDTPNTIALKMRDLINNTTREQWNQFNSAPTNAAGYPPKASASGDLLTISLNYQNQFFGSASIS
ncbi:PKD domain-containing protein [Chryseobacterium gambrini]|uniref:PKD domain-containing protein n=1 Tax=Chryseobacterium gambrini TaxID=373672 RepID=UPI003BA6B766